MKSEWIDTDGRCICGRCAAEAGLIYKNDDGDWIGLEINDHESSCWSCQKMVDEENIIEE